MRTRGTSDEKRAAWHGSFMSALDPYTAACAATLLMGPAGADGREDKEGGH
jgi:hypothetical protein